MNGYRMKDWPEGERPRERLIRQGPASLSVAELLAILIRTGTRGATALDLARRLLSAHPTLRDLSGMPVEEFRDHGIGTARATSLVAAFELARRLPSSETGDRPVFTSPEDVAARYGPLLRDLHHEEFWILTLNAANRLVGERRVTTGTLNASLVHPRECFKVALRDAAAGVIFLHNHPSGNGEPSQEDLAVTRQLVESGKILGIPVHDHIIIAGGSFTSFADRRLL